MLSWNSSTLATSCEELTHWKRLWCWEGLGAGGEGDDRGWDGWMASLIRWTWVWVNSESWWWTRRPGVLQFMGSQRVGHDWATELNWIEPYIHLSLVKIIQNLKVSFSGTLHPFQMLSGHMWVMVPVFGSTDKQHFPSSHKFCWTFLLLSRA